MLPILYQDEVLVAVNKPSGLLVHRSPIDRHETRFALQEVRDMLGRYVYPLHRIDKPTSGVLLFALDEENARRMTQAFRSHEVEKHYLAVVRGYTPQSGRIDHPLKQMLDTKAQKEKGITKEAQEAVTLYQRLATVELPYAVGRYATARYSLVGLMPKSGRKHQLRRHMKHIHHHIVGDTKHGRGEHNRFFREQYDMHRLLLHASEMRFRHPLSKQMVHIEAPLDETFSHIVRTFGWNEIELGMKN